MGFALSKSGGAPTIQVIGRFDFTANREFRTMCQELGSVPACTVDLKDATYVDSSALGMMLLLKEKVEEIKIVGASPGVRKVLEIANFGTLFTLE